MSLLTGFWGPPNPDKLKSMAAHLSHRHTLPTTDHHLENQLHLTYAPDHCSTAITGVAKTKTTLLALAGSPHHPTITNIQTLLEELDQTGITVLHQLTGPHIAIYHTPDHQYIIRDKSGRRTIYHTKLNGHTHFAIQTAPLQNLPEFTPEILPSSLAQYLTFSFIPGQNTMLRGLHELPAGAHLDTLTDTTTQYFHPEKNLPTQNRTDTEWIGKFETTLQQAIQDTTPPHLKNHHIFLSGGIDSSLVTAALAENHNPTNLQAHAIHFGKKYPNELPHARLVAQHTGVPLEEVEINPKNFLPHLHEIIQHLNDPIGDPVTMPNYLLAKHVADQGVHAVWNGEGGDPLFGGPKNMTMLLHHWYAGQNQSREQTYLASYRRAYDSLNTLLTPDYQQKFNPTQDLENILTPHLHAPEPESLLKKLLLTNIRLKGAHLILPKVEAMLGAHSVTPLSPLFDERLIRLAMELPGHLLLQNGIEKIILKKAFQNRLPSEIINRPKSGMRVPVHYWFKGELKRYAKKTLSPKNIKQAGIFDPSAVKDLLTYTSEKGPGRYGLRLWMLLTFEIWRKQIQE